MDPRNNSAFGQLQAAGDLGAPSELLDYPGGERHAGKGITKRNAQGRPGGSAIAQRNVEAGTLAGPAPERPKGHRPTYRHDRGETSVWVAAVGMRLSWVRFIVGLTQRRAGAVIGASQSTMASYEAGRRLLPPDHATRAAIAWGVTTDFLYRGLLAGCRRDVALRLAVQHPELVESHAQALPPLTVATPRPMVHAD